MTKVINLFAGPGAGKSTTAAALFVELKRRDLKCELVTEYAKDMTYERRSNILADQLYILAKQSRRIDRLKGVVDYIVTDSPLLLGLMYVPTNYYPSYRNLVLEVFNSSENCNFYIKRVKKYQSYGRSQTEEEAKIIDQRIRTEIFPYLNFIEIVNGDNTAPQVILEALELV